MTAGIEISGAEEMLAEGEGYFRVVERSYLKPKVFTPEIVHNLLSMSMEKFSMAILMHQGLLPENHAFDDLVNALKAVVPMSAEIESALLALDAESDLCSLEIRKSQIPGPERMAMLIGIGCKLRDAAVDSVRGGNDFPLHLE